jgi:NAD(P)-dependent dehydrogenase (short-subunit alcohol dehydrogenase family)
MAVTGGIMRDLVGKTAFVTGGASGIGYALGQAFAEAGMNVMLADIEADALAAAVERLRDGPRPGVRGTACDVADPMSVARAAEASYEAFGNVHVVCNNAGVAGGSGIDDISLDTWRWVLDVNLMGVLHGVRTFLPHIRAHREGGHIVNTASMAGLSSGLGFSPYSASKFAVVNLSEGLAKQVAPLGIGVTVLCPGFVQTRISESARNRPERYGLVQATDPDSPAGKLAAQQAELGRLGLDSMDVAAQVLTAIREDELYVFTHAGAEWRAGLKERFDAILTAMDEAARRSK